MFLPPFMVTPDKLDTLSPSHLATPNYAHIQVSDAKVRLPTADARTPDQATLASPELATPSKWSVSLRPEVTEWTPKYMRQFSSLAAKYALGELTSDEQSEYAELIQLRRRLNHPRSGPEVVLDYERQRAMIGLEEALRRYVCFFRNDTARR